MLSGKWWPKNGKIVARKMLAPGLSPDYFLDSIMGFFYQLNALEN